MNSIAEAFRSKRRLILIIAVASSLMAGLTSGVHAQGSMTMMVPFPPGGSTDIIARIIQPKPAERLGRPVNIEKRPGAASQIATQAAVRAAPDGNTVLVSFDAHAMHAVKWLTDNGSCYTVSETIAFGQSLGLVPCFTPVRSPESNGIAE